MTKAEREKWKSYIRERVELNPATMCWEWQQACEKEFGGRRRRGYSVAKYTINGKRTKISGHRLSYLAFVGNITSDLFVCHTCDVPWCVNPHHLFLGTHQDNMDDMIRKGRKTVPVVPYENRRRGAKHYRAVLLEEDLPVIVERLLAGETQDAIAEDYGITKYMVSRIRRKKAWMHVPEVRDAKYAAGHSIRLTQKKADAIRRLHDSGYSHSKLAAAFDVSLATIYDVLAKRTWSSAC